MQTRSKSITVPSPSDGVIQRLFIHQDAIKRHLAAPNLDQRQAYLGTLLAGGYRRQLVADRASTLCHFVCRGWFTQAVVTEDDILATLREWLGDQAPEDPKALRHRGEYFIATARHWTRYLGTYVAASSSECGFEQELQDFVGWLRHNAGFLDSSVSSCVAELKGFLVWLTPKCQDLSSVTLADIDEFIAQRRREGRSRHTILGDCQSIRTFFRYAEERGWNHHNLSRTVQPPTLRATDCKPRCPTWREIRSTLNALDTSNPSHIRARAIVFLASIYGLRRSEIGRLTLDDFDWQNEILTVRRSKRGRTQQFPLAFEVGEAVIRYLRIRPKSPFREVFLTMHSPFRPARNFACAIRKVLQATSTFERPWGMHSFRHACATELLRQGTSLRSIADFLGHRGIQAVSIYAHSDFRSLREVAHFDLEGLLCD